MSETSRLTRFATRNAATRVRSTGKLLATSHPSRRTHDVNETHDFSLGCGDVVDAVSDADVCTGPALGFTDGIHLQPASRASGSDAPPGHLHLPLRGWNHGSQSNAG